LSELDTQRAPAARLGRTAVDREKMLLKIDAASALLLALMQAPRDQLH
jgi:hypothetical protein